MIVQSRSSLKFTLPNDWTISRLRLFGRFISGSAFPDQYQGKTDEEIPFYKVSDLSRSTDGIHLPEPQHTISENTRQILKARLVPAGAIVYAKIGAASLLNRRRVTTRICCIDNNMTAYIPDAVQDNWAFLWLRCLDFGAYMCPATVPSISEGIQSDLPLAIPPKEYQQKIFSHLNALLPKIEAIILQTNKELALLSSYRQSLIAQVVTKGLDPNTEMKDSGLNWLGSIPKDWRISTIGKVMDVTLGKMLENKKANDSYTLERYLCAGSIDWGGVKQDYFKHMWFSPAEKNALLLKPDDCLIVEGGAGFGTVALYKGENYPCYFQNSIIRLREHGKVLSRFAKYWLHITYDSYLDTVCNKATFSHYTKEKVSATPILIPPLNEQEEIVDYLDKRVEAIDAVSKKLENITDKLTEYRSSLINAAVTGKLNIEEVTHGE